jgi:hypothetical protein
VPDDVGKSVKQWWPLLHRKSCRTLIAKTSAVIEAGTSASTEGNLAGAHVYRAAGEVCANQLTAASRDVDVDIETSGWSECSVPAVLLQRWVRLMIKALRGDATARSAVRKIRQPRCASESPSPPATESASASPSPTP